MNKKMTKGFVLAFAALISMVAISAAQQEGPWTGQYPPPDGGRDWLSPWSDQYSWQQQWNEWDTQRYPISGPAGGPGGSAGMYSGGAPPNDGPGGSAPSSVPSVSTGLPIYSLEEGESLSESTVRSLPGWESLMPPSGGSAAPLASGGQDALYDYYGGTQAYYGGTQAYYGGYYGFGGLQQWIYYCGRWTYGPAAMWYGQRTNTIIRSDQYQRIWSYERYPNGYEAWQYWGYWYPGYHHAWFGADARGWHQIAVWGSLSGWSNPIWVYVW